ncbi:MAG TPA: ComEC/Rec2 family competence protein [Candidatus Magasanikbacteria bacterium]|nr:ComEC/Rec2 family competence protein [Candidatus Magasanikbacteria bacterium]
MGGVKDFLSSIIKSKNKTLLAFCFCFVFATGLFSIIEIPRTTLFYFYVSIFVLLFFVVIFFEKKIIRLFLLIGVFFILGICRVLYHLPEINENFISYYNGDKYGIVGIISDEPNKKVGYREYEITDDLLIDKQGINKKTYGKILFKGQSYPEYEYGDKLQIECVLQSPKNKDNFNYQKFLALRNIYSVCYPQKIDLLEKNRGNRIMSAILSFKKQLNGLTQRLWVEPQSTLAAGILYGERSGFDTELKDNLSRAGITHIVAVSGYNITIIVWILMGVLIYAGFYRQQAFWICLVLIFLFVVFTGASASAVRAGLMGGLLLLAQQMGRKSDVFRLLVYAATLLALVNPLILVWDVGFQLSFLATIGLIYFTPLLEEKIKYKKFHKKFDFIIKEFMLPTVAATIFTFPLISYSFGYLSLFSVLANVLVIWLIPFLMFFSFISIFLAVVFYPLGQVAAWITNLGLSYVIMVGEKIGGLGFSVINWRIPLLVCLGCYMLLFLIITKSSKL